MKRPTDGRLPVSLVVLSQDGIHFNRRSVALGLVRQPISCLSAVCVRASAEPTNTMQQADNHIQIR